MTRTPFTLQRNDGNLLAAEEMLMACELADSGIHVFEGEIAISIADDERVIVLERLRALGIVAKLSDAHESDKGGVC